MFGYMYMPEIEAGQEYQGNFGTLDQIAAMEWAQTYAPMFGGDINDAVISGSS